MLPVEVVNRGGQVIDIPARRPVALPPVLVPQNPDGFSSAGMVGERKIRLQREQHIDRVYPQVIPHAIALVDALVQRDEGQRADALATVTMKIATAQSPIPTLRWLNVLGHATRDLAHAVGVPIEVEIGNNEEERISHGFLPAHPEMLRAALKAGLLVEAELPQALRTRVATKGGMVELQQRVYESTYKGNDRASTLVRIDFPASEERSTQFPPGTKFEVTVTAESLLAAA